MSTKSTTTRPQRGDGRRALLEAAIRVVSKEGLRGLTFRAVAAEAGVTHGLVNHHFGSRNALIEEALALSIDESISFSSLQPGTGDPKDFASALPETVAADPDTHAFQYEILLEARRRGKLMPYAQRMEEKYEETAARELELMGFGDDPVMAQLIYAALDGLVLRQVVFGDPESTRASIQRLKDMLQAYRLANMPAQRQP